LIRPVLQDQLFLDDVQQAKQDATRLHLWWLGQSGYLLGWQGSFLLIDPYLSDSLTTKYANTNKPHVRMTGRVVAPERLDFVSLVTSSHNHTDHLDGETLIPLMWANPEITIVVSEANRGFAAARLQVPAGRITGITLAGPLNFPPFTLFAVPSAHEQVELDEDGHSKYIGLVIQVGGWTLYHSGDTLLYDGMVQNLRRWKIDLALLPINGRDPQRGVAGNLSAEEAIQLGRAVQAGIVIPCHYEMFEFNTASPKHFACLAEEAGQPYALLQCGERRSF
jgi:L-ascorbate metabolism protein UlaG (beta-lactamase superfamily)